MTALPGYAVTVPFKPGRMDASQAQTDVESFAALEPTISFLPGDSRYAFTALASFGKSCFTEDPRAGAAFNGPTSMLPVEQARLCQSAVSKTFHRTDVKPTLGHETQNAEYGKIESDQGLMFALGPGRIRYLATTVRHSFSNGSMQATFEQAECDVPPARSRRTPAGGRAGDQSVQ